MEGPKSEKPPVTKEKTLEENQSESAEGRDQLLVEEVLSHVGEALQSCRSNPNQNTNHGEILHREIENTEISDLFSHYEKHQIISLFDINESIRIIVDKLEVIKNEVSNDEEELKFINTKFNLLKQRDVEISAGVRRYVASVAQFQAIKKQQLRLLPEDYRDKLKDIDIRRRKAHDALMQTLSIYTQLVLELKNEDYLEDVNVIQWNFGMDISDVRVSDTTVVVFSEKILANRDLIKDWAITAHLYQSLKIIEELEKSPVSNDDANGT